MISIKSIIGFSAPWCPNCPRMYPVWEKLEKAGYEVTVIDCDERPEVAQEYGVSSIPATLILEDGKEVARIPQAAPFAHIVDKIKELE